MSGRINRPTSPLAGLTQPQRLLWRAAGSVLLSGSIQSGQLVLRVTAPLRRLLGLPHDATGVSLRNVQFVAQIVDADRPQVEQAIANLIANNEPIDLRYRLRDAACELHLLMERHAQHADRVVGVIRAVSDAQAQARVVPMLAQVHRVDRAACLAELAAAWAHELNQPLAAVTTFAQAGERLLAQADTNPEKIQKICRELSQQALRAGEVMQRMRSVITPPAEHRETVSCAMLSRDFALLATPMAREYQVGFRVTQHSDAWVSVDTPSLQRVLWVLFENALEAVRELQRAEIVLVIRPVAAGVEIAMLDSGPGIGALLAGQLPRALFSGKPNGIGLGLSACQKWLERHGGSLVLSNRPEGGGHVGFVLPVVQPATT